MSRWMMLCLVFITLVSCSRAPEPVVKSEAVASDPASWVADLERANLRIDGAVTDRDAAARAEIERALNAPVPPGIKPGHARVMHQDLLFRLASLELSEGNRAAAAQACDRGLALGRHEDLFTANLLYLAGRAAEAQGQDKRAANHYYDALLINRAMLARVLQKEPETP